MKSAFRAAVSHAPRVWQAISGCKQSQISIVFALLRVSSLVAVHHFQVPVILDVQGSDAAVASDVMCIGIPQRVSVVLLAHLAKHRRRFVVSCSNMVACRASSNGCHMH
jgi:hypothetical protein